jgi:hypothetical protein
MVKRSTATGACMLMYGFRPTASTAGEVAVPQAVVAVAPQQSLVACWNVLLLRVQAHQDHHQQLPARACVPQACTPAVVN